MHIFSYNVKVEDLVELSLNRFRADPRLRLQANIFHFVIPLTIFLASMGTVYLIDADKQLVITDWIVPSVLAVFMLFLFPRTFESNIRKRVAAQVKEGIEKNMVGRYTTKILPELVVQTFKGAETRAPWTAISRTVITNEHIILLIDETQAIIIPRQGLPSTEHYEQAKALVMQYRRT